MTRPRTFLAGLLLAASAAPGSASPRVQVEPLFRLYRNHGLLPVRVLTENQEEQDRTSNLILAQTYRDAAGTTAVLALSLPAHSRKEHFAFIPSPQPLQEFEWRLETRGSQESKGDLKAEPVLKETRLVAVIGGEPVGLGGLRLTNPPFAETVKVRPPLPDTWLAWAACDVVVWPDPEPSTLRAEEREALERFVLGGGILVVALPRGDGPVRGTFLAALLPARASDEVSMAALPFAPEAAAARTRFVEFGGDVVAGEASDPLAVAGRRGHGTVVAVAFDLRAPAFLRGAAGNAFWQPLLERLIPSKVATSDQVGPRHRTTYFTPVSWMLAQMPGVEVKGVRLMGWLLAGYLLAIGPFDYLLLRRIGRQRWSWVTYPSYILVFSAAMLIASQALRPAGARVRALIVEDHRGDAVRGLVFGVLAGERRGSYELAARDPGLSFVAARLGDEDDFIPRGMSAFASRARLDGAVRGLRFPLEAWQPGHFDARWVGVRPSAGPGVEVNLQGARAALVSNLPFTLHHVVAIHAGRAFRVERLEGGGAAESGDGLALSALVGSGERIYDRHGYEMSRLCEPLLKISAARLLKANHARDPGGAGERGGPYEGLAIDRLDHGCTLVLGFAVKADLPLSVSGATRVETLLLYREFLCEGG